MKVHKHAHLISKYVHCAVQLLRDVECLYFSVMPVNTVLYAGAKTIIHLLCQFKYLY